MTSSRYAAKPLAVQEVAEQPGINPEPTNAINWDSKSAEFPDEWALLLAEIQENTCRKPFNPSEAVTNTERLLPLPPSGRGWRVPT